MMEENLTAYCAWIIIRTLFRKAARQPEGQEVAC